MAVNPNNNLNRALNGLNPLSYMGINATGALSAPQMIVNYYAPTINDSKNFIIGCLWLWPDTDAPNAHTAQIWMLTALLGNNATWTELEAGAATGIVTINGDVGFVTGPVVSFTGLTTAGSSVGFFGNDSTLMTFNVTDANENTLIGHSAGNATISGVNNTSLGYNSLHALTTGFSNVAIGYSAGETVTTGDANVIVGAAAGGSITSGAYNVIVGPASGISYGSSERSNILISNDGVTGESNVIRIGTTGTGNSEQTSCYIAGIDGVNVGSVARVVTENATQLGTAIIEAGSGIAVTPGPNSIVISSTGGGGGTGIAGSIIGTGGTPSNQLTSSSGTTWIAPLSTQNSVTKALAQLICPTPGTISLLHVNATANTSSTNVTVTLNVNGTNTSLVATVTALTTGDFNDTTHSISVNAGDLIQFECQASTTGTISGIISATFSSASSAGTSSYITNSGTAVPVLGVLEVLGGSNVTTSGAGNVITINSTSSGGGGILPYGAGIICTTVGASQGTSLAPFSNVVNTGAGAGVTPRVGIVSPVNSTISNFYVNVYINPMTNDNTFTVYIETNPTAITVTVPAGTTGIFSDLVHTATVSVGQRVFFFSSGGISGSSAEMIGSISAIF